MWHYVCGLPLKWKFYIYTHTRTLLRQPKTWCSVGYLALCVGHIAVMARCILGDLWEIKIKMPVYSRAIDFFSNKLPLVSFQLNTFPGALRAYCCTSRGRIRVFFGRARGGKAISGCSADIKTIVFPHKFF